MTTPESARAPEENRYQLVNTVAKKAKVIISHDMSAQISHNNAIRTAIESKDELPGDQSQPAVNA